jgi:hypothetical protein
MGLRYPIDNYQIGIPSIFFVEPADRLRKSPFLFHSFVSPIPVSRHRKNGCLTALSLEKSLHGQGLLRIRKESS